MIHKKGKQYGKTCDFAPLRKQAKSMDAGH